MKTVVILIVILPLFFSNCKRDSSTASVVTTAMDIAYKDNLGNDLLDPLIQNYFKQSNIHVYTVLDNVKTEVYNPSMTYPNGFRIYKNDELNQFFMTIYLESDTMLVQLNQNTTDTITCSIDKSNGNQILRKFWYNGTLKWEFGVSQTITIIK